MGTLTSLIVLKAARLTTAELSCSLGGGLTSLMWIWNALAAVLVCGEILCMWFRVTTVGPRDSAIATIPLTFLWFSTSLGMLSMVLKFLLWVTRMTTWLGAMILFGLVFCVAMALGELVQSLALPNCRPVTLHRVWVVLMVVMVAAKVVLVWLRVVCVVMLWLNSRCR